MPVACVVHAKEDGPFVQNRLAPALPILGFDRWLSIHQLSGRVAGSTTQVRDACGVFVIVVSNAAAKSAPVRLQGADLMKGPGPRPVLVQIDDTPPEAVASELGVLAVARVAGDCTDEQLADVLKPFLPPAREATAEARVRDIATPIKWNEGLFSTFLARSLSQQDFIGCLGLLERLSRHLDEQKHSYSNSAAEKDLDGLRRWRQFPVMLAYVRALRQSGATSPKVRRLYAQALIELGSFDEAVSVLGGVVKECADTNRKEYDEARGLLGRISKQRYVNEPAASTAGLLADAIRHYEPAFNDDPRENTWHGINAATCLVRAEADGLKFGSRKEGAALAERVLASLAAREVERIGLYAFERATRVEALAVLGDFKGANDALTAYLADPGAHAFEVSSTHRQFEQVLQFDRHGEGRQLVDRLWEAVERLRAPIGLRSASGDTTGPVSVLVTTMNASWKPSAPGCDVCGRVGPIVAMTCDRAAIKPLLSDPRVLKIEESRRAMNTKECATALPFINCVPPFFNPGGTFEEQGTNAIVAVIDEGIDVLHEAFRGQDGKSRIIGVWDQRDQTGPAPPGFTFGTYHNEAAIAGFVEEQAVPPKLGRDIDGHGTHVASIAAGRASGNCPRGVADDARILVVIADSASSIGYSNEHVSALDFIDRVATERRLPVVVNISQGMNSGPHDGHSPLENACDAFTNKGATDGRVIVKSAGNVGDADSHALVKHARGEETLVEWTRSNNPDWPHEYLEFWWDSANTYRFTLIAPNTSRSQTVDSGRLAADGQIAGCPCRMHLNLRDRFNGDAQLTVEIGSLAGNASPLTAGVWGLAIEPIDGDAPGAIHGWIERGPSRRSVFHPPYASPEMTITTPGTALSVITVGAIEIGQNGKTKATKFTSFGPTRDNRAKPEVCAPGIGVVAAKGGTRQDAFVDTGTSMAAPFVAGAVALVLSRAKTKGIAPPTAAQIRKVLEQKAKNRGPWVPTQGYGVVDVSALLAAF